MEITLKKASLLANAALEAAKDLQLNNTVQLSIFNQGNVEAEVAVLREKLLVNAKQALQLIETAYALRTEIGQANNRVGITSLLTHIKQLEATNKVRSQLIDRELDVMQTIARRGRVNEPIETIIARIAAMREAFKSSTDRAGREYAVTVKLLNDTDVENFELEIARMRRMITMMKDEIAALNHTTVIPVREEQLAVLKRHQLI